MPKPFSQPPVGKSQGHFAKAPSADIPRSTFDRSHGHKTTIDANYLYPIFVDEVLPGDTFKLKTTVFARMATPLRPIMDNLYMDVHYWFVPNRLVWDNWQRFMGEQTSPNDDITTLTVPQSSVDNISNPFTDISIAPYMGCPQLDGVYTLSALPFRAYRLIYNEWYRDQNLQDPVFNDTGDTDDSVVARTDVIKRNKRHDYFTSCLPFRQKGDPVSIPLAGNAPLVGIGPLAGSPVEVGPSSILETGKNDPGGTGTAYTDAWRSDQLWGIAQDGANPPYPAIFADLSEVSTVTISDLRTAFQIQKLLERDARGGTRYIELVLSHFGVRSDDARLQRPEFLGGNTNRVNINPIANTVGSDNQGTLLPQGELAAYGTAVNQSGWEKSFTEHGHILGLISTRADMTYQQSLERMWFRETRYDFYWPALAHLSEQAVLSREIYTDGQPGGDDVFGYNEVWAEYRYKPSRISGKFSSDNAASLDVWHLGLDFDARPVLNGSFIQEEVPMDRVLAVPTEPDFILDCWFDLKCTRPMPVYSVPGLIDHF